MNDSSLIKDLKKKVIMIKVNGEEIILFVESRELLFQNDYSQNNWDNMIYEIENDMYR